MSRTYFHGKIYEACRSFIEQGRIADTVTLKALFAHDDSLKDVGGIEYLAKLDHIETPGMNDQQVRPENGVHLAVSGFLTTPE